MLRVVAAAVAAHAAPAARPWLEGCDLALPCDVLFVKGKKVAGTTLGGVVRRAGRRHGVDFFSPVMPKRLPNDWRSGGRERWILEEFGRFASSRRGPVGWGQEQTLSPRRRGLRESSEMLKKLAERGLRITVVREPVAHAVSACARPSGISGPWVLILRCTSRGQHSNAARISSNGARAAERPGRARRHALWALRRPGGERAGRLQRVDGGAVAVGHAKYGHGPDAAVRDARARDGAGTKLSRCRFFVRRAERSPNIPAQLCGEIRGYPRRPEALGTDDASNASQAAADFYHAILLADKIDESLVALALAVPGLELEDVLYVSAKTSHTARRPKTEKLRDDFRVGLREAFYGPAFADEAPPLPLVETTRPFEFAADAHLYHAAAARLDATIEKFGDFEFARHLRRFRKMQARMAPVCAKGDGPKRKRFPGGLHPRDAGACIYGDQGPHPPGGETSKTRLFVRGAKRARAFRNAPSKYFGGIRNEPDRAGCGHRCIDAWVEERAKRLAAARGGDVDVARQGPVTDEVRSFMMRHRRDTDAVSEPGPVTDEFRAFLKRHREDSDARRRRRYK